MVFFPSRPYFVGAGLLGGGLDILTPKWWCQKGDEFDGIPIRIQQIQVHKSSDDFQNDLNLGKKNLTLLDLGILEPEDAWKATKHRTPKKP